MLSWTTEMSFRLDAEKSFPAGNGMLTSEAVLVGLSVTNQDCWGGSCECS